MEAKYLKEWLQQNTDSICDKTLYRAPNMLVDDVDVAQFVKLLQENVGESREIQLTAVQHWALTDIGHDAPAARDWLTILRLLKEEMVKLMQEQSSLEEAFNAWQMLDDILTSALIEATQLASDMDRAELLEHTIHIRRQMERLEETKINFIAVAAHELKTPLTILEGYTNMLRFELNQDSHLRSYIDGMENGTQRMHEIISDIIDVSMIDSQTFSISFQRFYLEKVILIVAERLDKYFTQRDVELTIVPLGVEMRIYGDPEKLSKAITKVLLNALKYTPNGGQVSVKSTLTRQDEISDSMAGYVLIEVQDSGIGIDPENLEIIFDKFTSAGDVTLHSSGKTKFKGGGPGLGLPIAKGIIEAHGGRIWAESKGHDELNYSGSTFYIELPILLQQPEATSLHDPFA